MHASRLTVGLLLMMALGALAAADPEISPTGPRDGDRGWCHEHHSLHRRLDTVEEQVEKTVEHLYAEVNSLLDSLSGASWALPVIPGASALDIFEEDPR
ncbi:placenta-specific protein 9 [Spea bombifrons]|uniref:placenta-specific protein 9 n=1 Tax=Spea bombifrons TaxID=233779 RepID=UPI00234A5060|nr:placenta-specific protein 9 [Spea bombifrons]